MSYSKVQFIAHCIHTAPKTLSNDKQEYCGLKNTSEDIAERVKLVAKALEAAKKGKKTRQDDSDTLKIYMMPEFFFRGGTGAYSMDEVQEVVAALQDTVKDPNEWSHWMFLFGTIIGKSFETRKAGFFEGLFGPKYVVDTTKPIEVYNYVLTQRGGFGNVAGAGPAAAHAVLKEHLSGLDFIKASKSTGGIEWERVEHLEPAREAGTASEVQVKGYDGNSVFSQDGLTFGVEVCLDHAKKRLKSSQGLPAIDIQLVSSCGMSVKDESIVARTGGYLFLCDGYADYDKKKLGFNSKVRKIGTAEVDIVDTIPLNAGDVQVNQIFARGAGEIRVYEAQSL